MDNDIVKLVVLLCTAVNGSIIQSISVNQSIDPSVNLSINQSVYPYIIQIFYGNVELRDIDKTYNLKKLGELSSLWPSVSEREREGGMRGRKKREGGREGGRRRGREGGERGREGGRRGGGGSIAI